MKARKGKIFLFVYPNYGDGFPEYIAHSGQKVKVLRRLNRKESDLLMYEVEASDGWRGHVHVDELHDFIR